MHNICHLNPDATKVVSKGNPCIKKSLDKVSNSEPRSIAFRQPTRSEVQANTLSGRDGLAQFQGSPVPSRLTLVVTWRAAPTECILLPEPQTASEQFYWQRGDTFWRNRLTLKSPEWSWRTMAHRLPT